MTRENQEAEANKIGRDQDRPETPCGTCTPPPTLFVPAYKQVMRCHQRGVVTSIDELMRCGPVPEAHQTEGEKKANIGSELIVLEPLAFHRGEEKPHVDVVAKPERESDVPAIPKVTDIVRQERAIEIFWGANSKQAAERDRERGVTGKIKKQIKAITIHVRCDLAKRCPGRLIDPKTFE